MNQPNPDVLARRGPAPGDELSDAELLKLINAAAVIKRGHGNFQSAKPPEIPKFIDYDAMFGAK